MEDEMTARHTHLQSVLQVGNDLISAGNFGADKIQERIDEINEQWESLIDLAAFRKKRLNEAVDFYQVCRKLRLKVTDLIFTSRLFVKVCYPMIDNPFFDFQKLVNGTLNLVSAQLLNEPSHETMVLLVLRKLILQMCMRSHPVELDVWFLVGLFIYFHTFILHMCKQRRLWWDCVDVIKVMWNRECFWSWNIHIENIWTLCFRTPT